MSFVSSTVLLGVFTRVLFRNFKLFNCYLCYCVDEPILHWDCFEHELSTSLDFVTSIVLPNFKMKVIFGLEFGCFSLLSFPTGNFHVCQYSMEVNLTTGFWGRSESRMAETLWQEKEKKRTRFYKWHFVWKKRFNNNNNNKPQKSTRIRRV